jgi:hypothetical protein
VEYADHLLDIVRSLGSAEGPAAALAMARRSQFEGRLLAILDNATPRGGVTRGLGLAALVLAAAAVLPLVALRALPAEAVAASLTDAPRAVSSRPMQAGESHKGALASIAGKLGKMMDRAVDAIPLRDTTTGPKVPAPALPGAPASAASAAGAASSQYGGTAPAPPVAPVSPPPPPSSVAVVANALGTSTGRAAAMLQDSGGYGDVIRAAAGISASSERASVLLAVLRQPDVSTTDLAAVFRVAGGISSDPSKRDVLQEAARRYSLAPAVVRRAFFGALATFSASPERRDVLLAVLARSPDAEVVSAAIQDARQMASEPERRDVLLKVVERAGSPELLQVVAASQELASSPVRRDLLVRMLGRPGLPSSVLRAVFSAAAAMPSSPEKRDVLVFGAEHQRLDGPAREAYLSAANTITASPEHAQALSAILGVRTAAAAPTQAAAPRAGSTTTNAHIHNDEDDGVWNSDIELTSDDGRVVRIRARQVVRGAEPDDIASIRRGGSLMIEETRNGRTRRADLVPAAGGRISRSYRVDGQSRPFEAEAERWTNAILREFTRAAK